MRVDRAYRTARHLLGIVLVVGTYGTAEPAATARARDSAGHGSGALQAAAASRWYRGNTHTHTDRSDGNASPSEVVAWYRRLGYHFVVITDHNALTPIKQLNRQFGEPGEFLVIAGEEVSATFEGKPVHVNGIGLTRVVRPLPGDTISEVIDNNARAIQDAGGLAQLNHPNLGWVVSSKALLAAETIRHFEFLNAHPVNNSAGGGGHPSTEELWDEVLSKGRVLYGLASDDAHDYDSFAPAPTDRGPSPNAVPGQAWIVVRSTELTSTAIIAAIERGDFYASTGVELERYEASAAGIRIGLPTRYRYRVEVPGELGYRTAFIGVGGRLLTLDESTAPIYRFDGTELYVRARIEASDGTHAWTQPVFPGIDELR